METRRVEEVISHPCLGHCPHGFPKALVQETVLRDIVQENGPITKVFPAQSFQEFRP